MINFDAELIVQAPPSVEAQFQKSKKAVASD